MNKKNISASILSFLGMLAPLSSTAKPVVWFDGTNAVKYNIARASDPVVTIAANMFANDMLAVTGIKAEVANSKKAVINVVQLNRASTSERRHLASIGVDVDALSNKVDGFCISVTNGKILIVGTNGRGCAYGMLEMSRKAGVSPWIWWGDIIPEHKQQLTIDDTFNTMQGASVELRGLFINDEDWSTRPWSYLNNDPAPFGEIGAKTYRRIFELLLRLRANAFWPAMHEHTKAFFQVRGAKEQQTVSVYP